MAVFIKRAAIPDDPQVRRDAFINFCNDTIAAAPDARRAMSMILDFIVQANAAVGAAIAVPEGDVLVVACSTPGSTYARGQRLTSTSLAGRVFADRKTFLANSTIDERADPARSHARIGTTVLAPIMQGRRAYGVLLVRHAASYGIHAKEAQSVSEFAGVCGMILGGAFYLEEKIRPRELDVASGLGGRRSYERDLMMQMELSRRFGIPVSVALFTRGGDVPPREWAAALRAAIRSSDAAYRISESVFAVVLKNCAEPQAGAARARIAQQLPRCIMSTAASPRDAENLRAFGLRLDQTLHAKPREQAPPASVWERFAKGVA